MRSRRDALRVAAVRTRKLFFPLGAGLRVPALLLEATEVSSKQGEIHPKGGAMVGVASAAPRAVSCRVARFGRPDAAARTVQRQRSLRRGVFGAASPASFTRVGVRPGGGVLVRSASSSPGGASDKPSSSSPKSAEYRALESIEVFRATDGSKVAITDIWTPEDRAVLFFARSFG